jgi:hypothetical protein
VIDVEKVRPHTAGDGAATINVRGRVAIAGEQKTPLDTDISGAIPRHCGGSNRGCGDGSE